MSGEEPDYTREESGENQWTDKTQSCFTLRSTIAIHSFRFWQGIVEIIARGILLVILLIVIGTCAAVIEKADEFHDRLAVGVEYENSQTAAAWALVSAFVACIYESIFIITIRLLNFRCIGRIRALTVDIIFNVVSALWLFTVAINLENENDEHSKTTTAAAFFTLLSVIAFNILVTCIAFDFLTTWMAFYLLPKPSSSKGDNINPDCSTTVPTSVVTKSIGNKTNIV